MAVIPLTPSTFVYRYGQVGAKPLITADRSSNWTSSSGFVSPASGTSTTLNPTNQTRTVSVTATSGADAGTTVIQIFATFPLQPNYGAYNVEMDDKTLVSIAEDGSAVFRVKGDVKRSWQLSMPERSIDEYNILVDFWNLHRKFTEFYYEDLALNILTKVRFDSGLKVSPAGPDQISMDVLVREV